MQTKPNSQHICAASWNRVSFVSAGGDCDRILPSPPPPPPPPPNSPARRAARPQGPRRAPPDCAAPAAERRRRPHTVRVCVCLCVCSRAFSVSMDVPCLGSDCLGHSMCACLALIAGGWVRDRGRASARMRRRAHLLLQAAEQAVGLPRRRPLPRSNEPEELLQRRKDLHKHTRTHIHTQPARTHAQTNGTFLFETRRPCLKHATRARAHARTRTHTRMVRLHGRRVSKDGFSPQVEFALATEGICLCQLR